MEYFHLPVQDHFSLVPYLSCTQRRHRHRHPCRVHPSIHASFFPFTVRDKLGSGEGPGEFTQGANGTVCYRSNSGQTGGNYGSTPEWTGWQNGDWLLSLLAASDCIPRLCYPIHPSIIHPSRPSARLKKVNCARIARSWLSARLRVFHGTQLPRLPFPLKNH